MVSYLRFLNIYFGEMLEGFLVEIGNATDTKKVKNTDLMVQSQVGYRSKLTIYDRPIVFLEVYYSRAVLFLVSWILKVIANLLLQYCKNKKSINKQIFFFIFFQRKIHYVLFCLALLDGPHLASRAIIHMVNSPESTNLLIEKIASVVFLVLIAIDFSSIVQFSLFFAQPAFDKNSVDH